MVKKILMLILAVTLIMSAIPIAAADIPKGENIIWLAPPVYASIRHVGEGLAICRLEGDYYCFIDATGEQRTPLKYTVKDSGNRNPYFNEGLMWIRDSGGGYGFIDRELNEVIPFIYESADAFSEGLAAVKKGGKWGYIDQTGKEVIPFIYDGVVEQDLGSFHEGLAPVKKDGKWGYIDQTGKVVIPFTYDSGGYYNSGNFSQGLAAVQKGGKWGYIDKTGELVIPFLYDHARDFQDNGLACVGNRWEDKWSHGNVWGVIDKTGREIYPLTAGSIGSFDEDLLPLYKEGKYGYIDKTGKEVIPFIYDSEKGFTEGLAAVSKGRWEWGFIDRMGEEVIPCIYNSVSYFSEGLAAVEKGGGAYGYVDKAGEEIIPCVFHALTTGVSKFTFQDGVAVVSLNGKYGLIANPLTYAKPPTPEPITDEISVYCNGEKLEFDVLPMMEKGRVLVPLRVIFEALGAEVEWDEKYQDVTVVKDNLVINFRIDTYVMDCYNTLSEKQEQTVLDVPPKIVNDRTLVPIRAVSEGLGARVEWDGDEYAVRIWTE